MMLVTMGEMGAAVTVVWDKWPAALDDDGDRCRGQLSARRDLLAFR